MFGGRRRNVDSITRRLILQRDGYRCGYCGTRPRKLHIDHIIPVHLGGSSTLPNLTPACPSCNRRKAATLTRGWMRSLTVHGAVVPAATARNILDNYFPTSLR